MIHHNDNSIKIGFSLLTHLNIDGNKVDEGLLGSLAVVGPSGDPDNVIGHSINWLSIFTVAVGTVLLVGTVGDLDLNVKV